MYSSDFMNSSEESFISNPFSALIISLFADVEVAIQNNPEKIYSNVLVGGWN